MMPPDILYSALLFVATTICLIAGSVVVQRRPIVPGSISLTVLLLALSWWDLTYAIFWADAPGPTPFFWLDITYVGAVIVPTAFLTFAMEISGLGDRLKKPFLPALFIEPLLVMLLLWTDSLHGLFFAGLRSQNSAMILHGGPVFWANVIYSYLLLLTGFVLLIRRFTHVTGIYRRQVGIVIAGAGITWLNSIIFLLGMSPFPNADNTPFSFTLAGMAFAFALLRYRLLDIRPIARDMLIEGMSDGAIVLDVNNRVVDMNPAAERILGSFSKPIIGDAVEKVFSPWSDVVKTFLDVNSTRTEVSIGDPVLAYFDLQISPLFDKKHNFIGRLIVWRDISDLKRIQAELEKLVTQDPLTLMHNRRHFYALAEMEIRRAARFKSTCSFVLIDLDLFKKINDTYGHQSGDQALIMFAKTCQENIRKIDVLARLGGEEFVILLPETGLKQAEETAERLREIIHRATVITANSHFNISASFGIAAFENEQDTLDTLLRKADQALYHAKNAGRNCVATWNEQMDIDWVQGKLAD
jgi:diguanylate cyclase (GGDEF)-like protein/PAS domain S-box-containing protein